MKLTKMLDFYDLDSKALDEEIIKTKKDLFDLRFKKATRQSFKVDLFRYNKRKLAQLLTLKQQRILNT